MCLCGTSLGPKGSLKQDWPGAEKIAFSNAYPRTPAPLSNLRFPPQPPTNALHLLEETFTSSLGHTPSSLNINVISNTLTALNVKEKYQLLETSESVSGQQSLEAQTSSIW